MSVWFCIELDALVIRYELDIDSESGSICIPIEWDLPDITKDKNLLSKYRSIANLDDLFTWKKIGDFD